MDTKTLFCFLGIIGTLLLLKKLFGGHMNDSDEKFRPLILEIVKGEWLTISDLRQCLGKKGHWISMTKLLTIIRVMRNRGDILIYDRGNCREHKELSITGANWIREVIVDEKEHRERVERIVSEVLKPPSK